MKKNICIVIFCSFCLHTFCQVNEDSVLLANSEKWKVQQHKGLLGLAKPDFGSFTTLSATRFDSTTTKKKTRDDKYIELETEGIGLDESKLLTIEKTKFYKLRLTTNADTIETVFFISSVSKEKRQTFLGKVLSKNDEGKDVVLDYNRDVSGIIKTGVDSSRWEFFIDNFTSGSRQTVGNFNHPEASISGGYIRNENDSLYMQTYSSFPADLILINAKGEHLAALKFRQKPLNVWIRNDLDNSYKKAIGALFAVIIGIRDL